MRRVVTLGESLAAVRSTQPGGFAISESAAVTLAGAESNVAIAVARLGVPSVWVGRVGDDVLGRRIVRDLRAEGVDTRARIDPEAPTGLLLKNQPRPGRTEVTYYRSGSAASRMDASDIHRADLREGDIVHLTGITPALSASAMGAAFAAAERARDVGALVSFDVNHRSRLWPADAARPAYLKLIAASDIVFAGSDEAALVLGGEDDPRRLAHGLAALGPREVVIKLGERGAAALIGDEWHSQDADKVDVVDTVGAGDAFVGAYLATTLLGWAPQQRLALAARNGAAACTHPGDWEGSASLAELSSATRDPVTR